MYVVYQNISSLGLCVCGLSCDCLCLLGAQIACFTGPTDGFCPALEYLTLRGKKYGVQEVTHPTLQHWTISWALNGNVRSLLSLLTSRNGSFCVTGFKLLQPAWGKSPENLAKLQTPTSVKKSAYKLSIRSLMTVSQLR